MIERYMLSFIGGFVAALLLVSIRNGVPSFGAYREAAPALQQLLLAINYGHFSEVMPQVHRNYYSVTVVGEKHFRLEHRIENSAATEARDIVLSELAMPHVTARPPDVRYAIEQLTHTVPCSLGRNVA
jgi:hypothetical protein